MAYAGSLSWHETDSLERQIAKQIVCIKDDAHIASFLKEYSVYGAYLVSEQQGEDAH